MPWTVRVSTAETVRVYEHVIEIMLGHHTNAAMPRMVLFHVEAALLAADHDIRAGDRIEVTWQPHEGEDQ